MLWRLSWMMKPSWESWQPRLVQITCNSLVSLKAEVASTSANLSFIIHHPSSIVRRYISPFQQLLISSDYCSEMRPVLNLNRFRSALCSRPACSASLVGKKMPMASGATPWQTLEGIPMSTRNPGIRIKRFKDIIFPSSKEMQQCLRPIPA
jgi:hypothetical protein